MTVSEGPAIHVGGIAISAIAETRIDAVRSPFGPLCSGDKTPRGIVITADGIRQVVWLDGRRPDARPLPGASEPP